MNELKQLNNIMNQQLKEAQDFERIMNFLMIIGLIVSVIIIIDCICAITDMLKSDFKDPNAKTLWFFIIFFLGPIGTYLYRTIGVKQKILQSETIDMFINRQDKTSSKHKWF